MGLEACSKSVCLINGVSLILMTEGTDQDKQQYITRDDRGENVQGGLVEPHPLASVRRTFSFTVIRQWSAEASINLGMFRAKKGNYGNPMALSAELTFRNAAYELPEAGEDDSRHTCSKGGWQSQLDNDLIARKTLYNRDNLVVTVELKSIQVELTPEALAIGIRMIHRCSMYLNFEAVLGALGQVPLSRTLPLRGGSMQV